MCSNGSHHAELRRIVTDWSSRRAPIRPCAPTCAELLQIDPAIVKQSVAARQIAPNCCRLIRQKCSNQSQRAELRQIGTDWSNQSAPIRPSAPNCAEMLQIDPATVQQSVSARRIVTNWFSPKCFNPSQRAELRQIVTD